MNLHETITKMSHLKRAVAQVINEIDVDELPIVLSFHEGMEFSKYKITIQAIEEDSFVDANGKKWKRVHDDD